MKGHGYRRICAVFLTGALALGGLPVPFAAPVLSTARAAERPSGMDDETWERLQDNTMDFDELADLVKCYNPTYLQMVQSIDPVVQDGRDTASEMTEEIRDYKKEIKELEKKIEEEGPLSPEYPADATQLMVLQMTVSGYEPVAKQIRSAANDMYRDTSVGREQLRKTLTSAAQQLFIGYDQAVASRELCALSVELAQAAEASAETQRSVGAATDNDVLSAQQALLSAQSQQMNVENTITSLRQQLCLMTGWSYNAMPEIGAVPAPDLERIAAIDTSEDVETAVKNSCELRSLRDNLSGSTMRRSRTMVEAEAGVRTRFGAVYQALMESKASYDAAGTALQAAEIVWDGNVRQYQVGMIGRLQYLQAQLAYLQQKLAADTASMNLTQAILNYEWALNGIMSTADAAGAAAP